MLVSAAALLMFTAALRESSPRRDTGSLARGLTFVPPLAPVPAAVSAPSRRGVAGDRTAREVARVGLPSPPPRRADLGAGGTRGRESREMRGLCRGRLERGAQGGRVSCQSGAAKH